MMPSTGQILCAPFTDETLYNEQVAKAEYWTQGAFYGIDLTPLAEKATEEYFGQVSAKVRVRVRLASLRRSGQCTAHVARRTLPLPTVRHSRLLTYAAQAVVGYFGPEILLSADRSTHDVDFRTCSVAQLQVWSRSM